MVIGLIFILSGILIAIYPPLLSFIVASVLILVGIFFIYLGYHYRKIAKKFDDPFIDFFLRL